jgi:EAL domain-containing protein (putative c-di-GMP-specific phosphodiesterase class I)/GGDEF domain-containing protein
VTKRRRLDQDTLSWHPCLEPAAETPVWVLVVRLDPLGRAASAVGVEDFDALVALARERLATVRGCLADLRRSGDDLVVLVHEPTLEDALAVARRCLEAVDGPWYVEGRRVAVRARLGLAATRGAGVGDAAQPIADARAAIAAATLGDRDGNSRVAVADAVLRRSLRRDMNLEAEVALALERDELELAFQPIVSSATGRAAGAEALLRWGGATGGIRGPVDFLEAARRSGVMPEVTAWVLETAIATSATWPPDTFVSINLDPADLTGPAAAALPERFADACRRHVVEPSRIWLEVTEHAVDHVADVREVLGRLASLGARIALDDLGSGSASLSRLHELPFEVCKVDRSLVRLAERKRPGADLLRAVVSHAHACQMTVVAEGVETSAMWRLVAEAGCDLAQGFHLYRPMKSDDVGFVFSPAGPTRQAPDAAARMLSGA